MASKQSRLKKAPALPERCTTRAKPHFRSFNLKVGNLEHQDILSTRTRKFGPERTLSDPRERLLPPPSPPRARLVTTTAAAATTTTVFVVARVIFMRRNPGAAKDGSVKVSIVARVIFERRKPKKACCCAVTRTRARPRTRSKPNTSTHACRHHPWPAPNCPYDHAPQGFFINGFVIVARSFSNCPTLQGTKKIKTSGASFLGSV